MPKLTKIAAALIVAATATAARADTPTTRPATQPAVARFEVMGSGHIAVMAKVNDRGPYRFVFDTGAPTSLVSEKVATAAGVLPKKFRRPFFTILGNLGPKKVKSVDIGGGRLEDVKADVWNHPTVDLIAREEGPLAGIIGFPFFARFRTTIDYRTRTMTFTPSTFKPTDTAEQLQALLSGDDDAGPNTIAPTVAFGLTVDKGDATAPGVTVKSVAPNGPAAAAGVAVGDRLLTLDGRWTDAVADVYTAAAAVDPKAGPVPLVVRRAVKTVTLNVAPTAGI